MEKEKKRCHYEILEVERNAKEEDIKRSYKKLTKMYHPDKNPENREECLIHYKLIQQAYEVLMNPQERAFYDKYRESILRGGEEEEDDLNLFSYFDQSNKCFQNFDEGKEGNFYETFRKLFENISKIESENGSTTNWPVFGKQDEGEHKVTNFYNVWAGFKTSRKFYSEEKYDVEEGQDRMSRRIIERENEKLKKKAKKMYIEEVRNLVTFVKNRDPRIKKINERLRQEQEKKNQEMEEKKKKRSEIHKQKNTSSEKRSQQLLEEELNDEFLNDQVNHLNYKVTDNSEINEIYECVICNKTFKSEKQMKNHESSNRHKQLAKKFREELLIEGEILEEDVQKEESSVVQPEEDNEEILQNSPLRNMEKSKQNKRNKKNQKKRQQQILKQKKDLYYEEEEEQQQEEEVVQEISESPATDENQEIDSNTTDVEPQETETENGEEQEDKPEDDKPSKSKRKKNKKRNQKKLEQFKCRICNEVFQTRNAMFTHIKEKNHAQAK